MLRKLFEKFIEDETKEEVRVGRVSPEISAEMMSLRDTHDEQHEEIQEKVKAYLEKLIAEHEVDCVAYRRRMSLLWEKVYDELNVTEAERGETYRINHVLGIVYREVDKKAEVEMEFDFN